MRAAVILEDGGVSSQKERMSVRSAKWHHEDAFGEERQLPAGIFMKPVFSNFIVDFNPRILIQTNSRFLFLLSFIDVTIDPIQLLSYYGQSCREIAI